MSGLFGIYFEEIPSESTKGRLAAKCLKCPDSKKNHHSYAKGVTSNLTTHLRKVHPTSHKEYEDSKKLNTGAEPVKKKQKVQSSIGFSLGKCSQEVATKLIMSLIVSNGLPVNLVEKPEFKILVEKLSRGECHSITRKTLLKKVDNEYQAQIELIKAEIAKVKYCCTTADIWSNKKRSFMGMTCHLIDPETLTRKSFPIGCDRFKGNFSKFTFFALYKTLRFRYSFL